VKTRVWSYGLLDRTKGGAMRVVAAYNLAFIPEINARKEKRRPYQFGEGPLKAGLLLAFERGQPGSSWARARKWAGNARPGHQVSPRDDKLAIDGHEIHSAGKIYLLINKPHGLVTSASDEKGRDTVYSLLPEYKQWLAPVGRLDKASEGLLLFTNDSRWAARLSSPETHLDKIYYVQIGTVPGPDLLKRFASGVKGSEGDLLKARRASIVRHGPKNCWLRDRARPRQEPAHPAMSVLGIEILRLVRIGIGPLRLGDLAKGAVRELAESENGRSTLKFRG
jgi:23S rRNA pseudouridine2605 synthase